MGLCPRHVIVMQIDLVNLLSLRSHGNPADCHPPVRRLASSPLLMFDPRDSRKEMNEDNSYLNSLSVAHYAVGGFMVLISCMPLIHVFIGLSFIIGGEEMFSQSEEQPPEFFGWIFLLVGILFFIFAQAVSISVIVSGRFLKRRTNYLFSFILACIACMFVPIGTVLGIFTIIVLSRDSVKRIYKEQNEQSNEGRFEP